MSTSVIRVGDVMTRDPVTVTPDIPLKDVAAVLSEHGISGLPVCDREGAVVGVLSEADLLVKQGHLPKRSSGLFAWLLDTAEAPDLAKLGAHTAGEAMTSPAITIDADRPVAEAARAMVSRRVNRLPVLENGSLVGIVSRADIVRLFTRRDEEIRREILDDVAGRMLWIATDTLEVEVEHGEVVLRGAVDTESDATLLERHVALVPGVVAVRSELKWAIDREGHPAAR